MLWRWLSVHAHFFETNRKAYLDGATTERLGAWFERIKRAAGLGARPSGAPGGDGRRHRRARMARGRAAAQGKPRQDLARPDDAEKVAQARLVSLCLLILVGRWAVLGTVLYCPNRGTRTPFAEGRPEGRTASSVSPARCGPRDSVLGRREQAEPARRPRPRSRSSTKRIAARRRPAGSFISTSNGRGYVWIGSVVPGRPQDVNLLGAGNRPVEPGAVGRGRSSKWPAIRSCATARLAPPPRATSAGIVARGSLVRIETAPVAVRVEGRTEYWARVALGGDSDLPRPVVWLSLNVAGLHRPADWQRQLARPWRYRRRTRPTSKRPAAREAESIADPARDRSAGRAARRRRSTRWIAAAHTSAGDHGDAALTRATAATAIAPNELVAPARPRAAGGCAARGIRAGAPLGPGVGRLVEAELAAAGQGTPVIRPQGAC